MNDKRQLIKKIKFDYKLELITGLRIGDSKENVEIGGVDAPVIRRKDNQQPYIPGSSIKGKIRCLLELSKGINMDSECRNTGDIIQQLFGASERKEKEKENENEKYPNIPSRLIVRDAYLTEESVKKFKQNEFTDMPYTEIKAENKIDRKTGKAESPRLFERVPAGAVFNVEFIINIFEGDDQKKLEELLQEGIKLLELDYLGGSGSRGYGQVKFDLVKITQYKIERENEIVKIIEDKTNV